MLFAFPWQLPHANLLAEDIFGIDRTSDTYIMVGVGAANAGELVVHGRGRHSEAAPVLRNELPDWLQERPLAALVMAFCTAPASRGGSGALLVLLRRAR